MMTASKQPAQYPIKPRKFSSEAAHASAARIAIGIMMLKATTTKTIRGTFAKIGSISCMQRATEYMEVAMLPITLNARAASTNLPKPPAGANMAAMTPPMPYVSHPDFHSGTLLSAPPIAAPRMRSGTDGVKIPSNCNLLGGLIGVVVRGEVRCYSAKGNEVSRHDTSIVENLSCCRRGRLGLLPKVLSTAAYRNHYRDKIRKPLPPFPHVKCAVTNERSSKTDEACDDDANFYIDMARVDSCESLAPDNRGGEGEASYGSGIEEERDGSEVISASPDVQQEFKFSKHKTKNNTNLPKGVPGLDELPQSGVGSSNAHECRRHNRQHRKEKDHQRSIPQTQTELCSS
ncbi:hypothetical protein CI238_13043 [Colletotrichum incanum]|uniref:Uncharacterized protein n=1 Tax=Colletotrichum incanum TaxID=1573173 RepID=A0A162P7Y5_COLIC|nr:hypothetical protein CI238_13043 [Colletotrichum incanum]